MKLTAKILKKHTLAIAIALTAALFYYFCLPERLFNDPYSSVVEATSGELLCATIAADGQWRFPPSVVVPEKYKASVLTFEDKRFQSHHGVDIISLGRAMKTNISRGKVVSGGSTITMQVVRLARKPASRSILQKALEMVMATRLEFRYSKDEILNMYAAHAPFGRNVVGLEAACWRYFGRSEKDLSWAEAALLAVLPNAPSMIHPGKNREKLKQKRDALLDRLVANGTIDEFTARLSKEETIPDEPVPLPRYARHLIQRMDKDGQSNRKIRTSVDFSLQTVVEQILSDRHQQLRGNQIHNAAAIVARVSNGEVIAYAGNTGSRENGSEVDIITSRRSTGSILKPFLYCAMLDEGRILPKTLLPDIPTYINGFAPKNFSRDFDGAVPANKMLIRSLNVPAVHMLRDYRYEKFFALLKNVGMTTLDKSPDHYGLSMILGGAEATLWDIAGMYASMARTLNNYSQFNQSERYAKTDFHPLSYFKPSTKILRKPESNSYLSAASIYWTFEALKELYRPGEESGWRLFESTKKIAWKTGTSFGYRDGWAIGVTPEYVVGVWVGNADGEGRPGLTGTDAAAPIMFDIFSQLNTTSWFTKPADELRPVTVCSESGFRISEFCPATDTLVVPVPGLETLPCPFHKRVHLSQDRKFQVNNACADLSMARTENWFVLPPVQEYYFRTKNIHYKPLPPFFSHCPDNGFVRAMDIVYPKSGSKVFIPRDLQGIRGKAILHLAHRNPGATVFWHLDGVFVGATQKNHSLPVNPDAGKHTLLVIDETGESIEQNFEVLPNL